MSIFSRRPKRPYYGDSKVAVLENWGGRPTIAGPNPKRTQENMLRIIQGLPPLLERPTTTHDLQEVNGSLVLFEIIGKTAYEACLSQYIIEEKQARTIPGHEL